MWFRGWGLQGPEVFFIMAQAGSGADHIFFPLHGFISFVFSDWYLPFVLSVTVEGEDI